ncbi:MAG: nitronate monooxygenase [Ottowia sp.]|nr:MAG: nitronate monooxygenase [Ottowia sp.]HQQ52271.1 nitronate monooxygenase family protein [Ottowia sp.]
MNNRLCQMFGIEAPIFAFSHCRDVVVEVSKAGGLGVLGMARAHADRVEEDLRWIDAHIEGRPYGVDILMPARYEDVAEVDIDVLPAEHVAFVQQLLDDAGVPRLLPGQADAAARELLTGFHMTPRESLQMLEICLRHPIKLIVNALGSPPPALVERAHALGIKVGALAGKVQHALKHRAAGCDLVVAVGTEAAGHTGDIASMVLWPRIADAVAPLPVLGAGGVGRGRQLAAALALGCEGVWCGSIWLKTVQSELTPEIRAKLYKAGESDAVLTRTVTGKSCRTLRNAFTEAYDRPGAPEPLPAPLQNMLWWAHGRTRVERARAEPFLTYPVGQLVGDMNADSSVRQVVQDMLLELAETKERLDGMLG